MKAVTESVLKRLSSIAILANDWFLAQNFFKAIESRLERIETFD